MYAGLHARLKGRFHVLGGIGDSTPQRQRTNRRNALSAGGQRPGRGNHVQPDSIEGFNDRTARRSCGYRCFAGRKPADVPIDGRISENADGLCRENKATEFATGALADRDANSSGSFGLAWSALATDKHDEDGKKQKPCASMHESFH
jgi:hypothetical protein